MKIIKNNYIPFEGFNCINLFGFFFTRKSSISERTIRHEMIHTEQMKEMLYIFFYIWYLIEYLIRGVITMFYANRTWNYAYKTISFESEAYSNQDDLGYLSKRKRYSWLRYIFKNGNS